MLLPGFNPGDGGWGAEEKGRCRIPAGKKKGGFEWLRHLSDEDPVSSTKEQIAIL